MVDRHRLESHPRALEDAAGKPVAKDEVVLRISDQSVEWTDEDRARWRQAHEPWWKPSEE